MGRDVGEVLALSDPEPIGVVREWGVRKLGLPLELSTRAAIRKPVTVDLFPAYDDDGGLLVGADAARHPRQLRLQRPCRAAARSRAAARPPAGAVRPVERRRRHGACGRPRRAASRRRRTARPRRGSRSIRAVIRASSGSPRPVAAHRVGAGAVDRGPHDLGRDSRATQVAATSRRRGPARGRRGSRGRRRRPGAADEALVELGRAPARRAAREASRPRRRSAAAGGSSAGIAGRAPRRRAPRRRAAARARRRAAPRAAARAAAAAAASPRRPATPTACARSPAE